MAKSDLRIKDLCKERGITQAQLAEKIGIKPVSFSQAVARNNFDMQYLKRIADALDVEVVDLFAAGQIKCPYCGQPINLKADVI